MWVEFVLGSLMLREVFLRVLRFSPLRKKTNYKLEFFEAIANDNGNSNDNSNNNNSNLGTSSYSEKSSFS